MRYNIEQRVFIEKKYAKLKSPIMVQRAFRKEFKTRNAPHKETIINIVKRFEKTGSVKDLPRKCNAESSYRVFCKKRIKKMIKSNPSLPIRVIAQNVPTSYSTARDVLKTDMNLWPYKIQERQEIQEKDYEARLFLAHWFQALPAGTEMFMIFSDEAYFTLRESSNRQNTRLWLKSKPEVVKEVPLYDEKVLVWCAISAKRIFGPYFFEDNVKSKNYLQMLKTFFWPKVLRTESYQKYYFQQDGATSHTANTVQKWLTKRFKDRFMDKELWPARSPDLNPCDFFLWGYLKAKVYNPIPKNLEDLKRNIAREIENIKPETLEKVFANFKERCQLVINNNGGHIE